VLSYLHKLRQFYCAATSKWQNGNSSSGGGGRKQEEFFCQLTFVEVMIINENPQAWWKASSVWLINRNK
jgi:hypothetical protein